MTTALLTIWFLHAAALISPGPNMLLVSQLAASGRRDSAKFAGFGIVVGAAFWAVVVMLGGSAIFVAVPVLRLLLQIVGALYLLWLAIMVWRSKPGAWNETPVEVSHPAAFRLGLLASTTNPKSAFFYGVFAAALPAHASHAVQAAAVALIVINATLWYTALAWLFSRQRVRTAYASASGTANRLTAICFGVFSTGLLISALHMVRS